MTMWGPIVSGATTHFRLWAPAAETVSLELQDARLAMSRGQGGWWRADCAAAPGTRYRFRIGETAVPDPASRAQAGDVHGWSVVCADAHDWRYPDWRGLAWAQHIIYECHAGLAGGFRGLEAKLDELAKLGITAVELMPVGEFPGARNWGYDGVLPFAPDEAYGTPGDLKHLIDEAHGRGIAMFVDVIYNHFGPDGNYLPLYAPQFFRGDRKTPWGDAFDFRRPEVRAFCIENALYWLNEFRFDGLRLDAVHAIEDNDFVRELVRTVRANVAAERRIHIAMENEDNDCTLLGDGVAQWNDDLHHAIHVLLTGESAAYYGDFAEAPAAKLARALGEGFVYQGEFSPHRGAARGSNSAHLAPTSFIAFLQNHDQTGNRACGERLLALASEEAVKAAAALVMLSPQIPMLFMGEEIGAQTPFLYFTDHRDPALAQAVREGRRAEFKKFPAFANEAARARIPDPNALDTFERSRPRSENAPAWRAFYGVLIALRRREIAPRLNGARSEKAQAISEKAVLASWRMGDGARLTLAANLGATPIDAPLPDAPPIWGRTNGKTLGPFTTLAWIEAP